ncbi:MAG: DNA adenine methylase [Patescibacteria group bacterium]|nr:DNA adenine methylase [Patescibacteria group bacterium]
MTELEGVVKIQENFGINPIYSRVVFSMVNKENLLEDAAKIIGEKPKPFVKWVGGKRQLLKQFKELGLYTPDGFDPLKSTYHEPFVGGGAVFLDLLPKKAILSDLNPELITTYKVIKNDVGKLIKLLKTYKYDKDFYLKIRNKRIKSLSDIQVAARFIYLNRTCFNGLYRVNSKGEFNVPMGEYNNPLICDEDNLKKISKALKNVKLYHEDYKKVLQRAKKGDFIYFDPPYYPVNKTSSFTNYTAQDFLEKEQEELRDTFLALHKKGCFVMLSNSDTPFINKLYSKIDKKIKVNKVFAGRNINSDAKKRGKIKEVLVINY